MSLKRQKLHFPLKLQNLRRRFENVSRYLHYKAKNNCQILRRPTRKIVNFPNFAKAYNPLILDTSRLPR